LEENGVDFHMFEAVQPQGVPSAEHNEDLPLSAAAPPTLDFSGGYPRVDSALPSSDRGGSSSVPAPVPLESAPVPLSTGRVPCDGCSTAIAPDAASSLMVLEETLLLVEILEFIYVRIVLGLGSTPDVTD
jgi:hypothetical protein